LATKTQNKKILAPDLLLNAGCSYWDFTQLSNFVVYYGIGYTKEWIL
jgi:hypothetical protein